jgi:hypothetical protein
MSISGYNNNYSNQTHDRLQYINADVITLNGNDVETEINNLQTQTTELS